MKNGFAVPALAALFPALLFLPACDLLFVAKGRTDITAAPAIKAPKASSQAREIGRDVLEYEVQAGDSLGFLSWMYYGDKSGVKKLARANRLRPASKLKPGKILRIVGPLYFPDPDELKKKRGQWTARATRTAIPSRTPAADASLPFSEPDTAADEKDVAMVPRPKVNLAFGPGEKLTYQVKALSLVAGFATLEVGDYVMVGKRPCTPLIARARAAFPFNNIYPVNDLQTSYFDSVDFLTWKFENNVHEGGYKARNLETYDQIRHTLVRRHNDEDPLAMNVAPFTQDIISCFYYFRLLPIKEGLKFAIPTSSGGKNYKLIIRVLGKERITVPAGTFECYRIKPFVKHDTVFRNKEDIDLWVTADQRHIPILIKSGIVIGSIEVTLLNASVPQVPGEGDKFTSRLSP